MLSVSAMPPRLRREGRMQNRPVHHRDRDFSFIENVCRLNVYKFDS